MYQQLPVVEFALTAVERPEETVMRDRNNFAIFFEIAEKYINANDLIVGGAAATLLLQGGTMGPEDFFYELYSVNARADALALTDLVYEAAPEKRARYAAMISREPEFEIIVDERPLFLIKTLTIHRGARMVDVLVPSLRPAHFARSCQLLCMGPEVQLISVYSALSDPSRAGEWASLVYAEEKLRALFEKEIRGKMSAALDDVKGGAEKKSKSSRELIAILLREYVPLAGHALVGSFGNRALAGKNLKNYSGRLQLVSANTFRNEEAAIRKIISKMGFSICFSQHEYQMPSDDKLWRQTMYLRLEGRREPLLDIYNSGGYQLIACTLVTHPEGEFLCGTPFTILRFILVDIWTIQLLFRMGIVLAHTARQYLKELIERYISTATRYLVFRDANKFDAIFSTEYIGEFRDPVIRAKRDRFRMGGSGETYYPVIAKKEPSRAVNATFLQTFEDEFPE